MTDWPRSILVGLADDFPKHRFVPAQRRHWVLSWAWEGRGRFDTDIDGSCPFADGDLLLTPPGRNGVMVGEQAPWQRWWCAFHDGMEPSELLDWGEPFAGRRRLRLGAGPHRQRVHDLMRILVDAHLGPPLPDRLTISRSLLHSLLLMARAIDQESRALTDQGTDSGIEPALSEMHHHFHQPLTVAGLARRCGLSESRFAHRFAAAMGTSPMRHLEGVRMEQARHLLRHSDAAIADIAARCGWPSHEHFSRLFSRRHGVAPSVYRDEAAQL